MKNKISKANQEIFELLQKANEINEFEPNQDYDTRESYICANIKVYEWLNDDDVKEVVKNLNDDDKEIVLEEFNENRLNSIYNHVCQNETDYMKDFIGGCSHTNFNKAKRAFQENLKNECSLSLRFYHEHFKKEFSKFKDLPSFIKHLEKTYSEEYKEFYFLQMLDSKNVWQFGRSGGWLSVAKCTDLENFCEDSVNMFYELKESYYKDDNNQFNEVLKSFGYNYETLAQTRKRVLSEINSDIASFNEQKESIEWILGFIEKAKKGFKESLLHQLDFEINEFINDNLSIDNKIDSYLNGDAKSLNSIESFEDGIIKTNLGAKVTIEQAIKAIQDIKEGKTVLGQKVGLFTIEKVVIRDNKTFVKIGCHVFNLEDIEKQIMQVA